MVRRNFTLPEELDQSLDKVASLLGDNKSGIVSKALVQYFDRLDLEMARERAAAYESGADPRLDLKTLRKKLG